MPVYDDVDAPITALLSSAVAAFGGLLGGVALGGWYAFRTPHWEAYRAWTLDLPLLSAWDLGVLLFALAVAAGVGVTWIQSGR